MQENTYPFDILSQVTSHIPNEVTEIVLMQRRVLRQPEAHILVASWILGVRLESRYLALLELRMESWIF